ncbi:hypothetical protein LguiA_032118 [Lonicera macranthoides]
MFADNSLLPSIPPEKKIVVLNFDENTSVIHISGEINSPVRERACEPFFPSENTISGGQHSTTLAANNPSGSTLGML